MEGYVMMPIWIEIETDGVRANSVLVYRVLGGVLATALTFIALASGYGIFFLITKQP